MAVRIAKNGGELPDNDSRDGPSVDSAPPRTTPPESSFEDPLLAEEFESYELDSLIDRNHNDTDGDHGIHVLDCTSPLKGDGLSRTGTLHGQAAEKAEAGKPLSKRREAA